LNAAFTVRVKDVVLTRGATTTAVVLVAVIVKAPVGVEADVVRVSTVEHVGLQEATEKFAVTPLGSPDTEKNTGCVWPLVSVAVIVVAPEPPAVTVTPPEFDRV
jgi:hypothetical protein